jgi:ABC-type multidrug transport system permease subunit
MEKYFGEWIPYSGNSAIILGAILLVIAGVFTNAMQGLFPSSTPTVSTLSPLPAKPLPQQPKPVIQQHLQQP